ncbi:Nucleotide-binding alpha-beta plait [Penicillium riverlandense]|uniref:Nucleotide-binding alpha-beta plait n=1 Tax=Penicillium riverlandense TaxID=1903569 RepID=UPI002548371B|nr:Nucleotide-binding alpha-beta plait [Penicillium riverlandense]KAJ5807893.1 Nucleotide-binding alpha-beta plait [Penicillium riverlandense]
MPFLGREKARGPRLRRSDDEFVVFLQGIPAHCRWQELKDLVRQTALHIRQAVVYDDSHGVPTGLGQIIVKNEDEAWRTYHRLSTNGWDGQSLVVTLARTSSPTKPIAGPTRSPPAMMPSGYVTPPRGQGNPTMPPSPISPESVHSSSPTAYSYPDYGPMMSPMGMPPQQFMPMMTDTMTQPLPCYPSSPLMHCTMYDPPAWAMMPAYPMPPMHPLHETAAEDGTGYQRHPRKQHDHQYIPNTREISIHNLSTSATNVDLKNLLQGAGAVEQCTVTATSDVKTSYGSATMHSTEEARRAVSMFNNMSFMGAQLRVKMARGSHASRGGSWDGTVLGGDYGYWDEMEGLDWAEIDERRSFGATATNNRPVDPCQPLVVDGSGQANKSVGILSTSAPT